MEAKSLITVRSLTLLKELSKAKCLGPLIEIEGDKLDPAYRPVYRFLDNDNVRAVVKQFIDTYGADDRSMDDWSYWYAAKFYGTDNMIVTRNVRIANAIIEAGYAANLCSVFKEPNGHKRAFKFLVNDEINKIKTEGDAASAAWYAEKMKDEINHE